MSTHSAKLVLLTNICSASKSDTGSTICLDGPMNMATDGDGQCSSAPGQVSHGQVVDVTSVTSRKFGGKHQRDEQDENAQDNGDGRSPKRPRALLTPPRSDHDSTKFACPYRKRDPRKYCVQSWRTCALTALDTVARVKYVICIC